MEAATILPYRYNTDGSLDNTFGTNGITTTLFYADDEAYSVAIQSDGKIVAAGTCEYNNFYNLYGFAVIRYTGSSSCVNSVSVAAADLPKTYALYQNYPNPFNPSTIIKYSIPKASYVTIKIYNMLGQEVKTLVNDERDAGTYSVQWNGDNNYGEKISSGTYIYRIIADNNVLSRKMVLLK